MDESGGFDPKRRLCPDGACTGVIGPDGRCNECGRSVGSAGGRESNGGASGARSEEVGARSEGVGARASGGDPGAFDPGRRLCDDGACVGVIGDDGSCTVCGRMAS